MYFPYQSHRVRNLAIARDEDLLNRFTSLLKSLSKVVTPSTTSATSIDLTDSSDEMDDTSDTEFHVTATSLMRPLEPGQLKEVMRMSRKVRFMPLINHLIDRTAGK